VSVYHDFQGRNRSSYSGFAADSPVPAGCFQCRNPREKQSVIRLHVRIEAVEDCLVHFLDCDKRASAVANDISVPEMEVRSEPDIRNKVTLVDQIDTADKAAMVEFATARHDLKDPGKMSSFIAVKLDIFKSSTSDLVP
jgi:hypothetical protein